MNNNNRRRNKQHKAPLPPPTLVGIFLRIRKLGRRRNKDQPCPPIECTLQGLSIEDEGAIALIAALIDNNVQVSTLDLSACGLTCNAAKSIAAWLATDTVCHTLCLHGNDIRDSGGVAIAKALQSNRTLTCLKIENNRLSTLAGHAFGTTLRTNATAFRELNLLANPLGSEGVRPIFMSCGSNRPRILKMHLRRCDIGCEGVVVLAQALRTNETITYLDLNSNLIEDEGAAALASALKHDNRTLRVLDLRNNFISTAMYALEDMISTNRSLRLLQVEGNDFAGDWEALAKGLERQMDYNEIGYWKIVEQEMKEERERQQEAREAAEAYRIEQELLMGKK
jgi:Ran GTPase-activating protein (RanGAP) involved in mRNA processing and transport